MLFIEITFLSFLNIIYTSIKFFLELFAPSIVKCISDYSWGLDW
jgi:hypothetical protein